MRAEKHTTNVKFRTFNEWNEYNEFYKYKWQRSRIHTDKIYVKDTVGHSFFFTFENQVVVVHRVVVFELTLWY